MASRFLSNPLSPIAVLRPLNSSDLKACIKSCIHQFMTPSSSATNTNEEAMELLGDDDRRVLDAIENEEDVEDEVGEVVRDGEGGGAGLVFTSEKIRKPSPFDIRILESWFARKSKKTRASTVLIISIPEFERFDTIVFQDLVKLCSASLDTLPFVFLLGISTTLDIVHNNLHKSVLRLLRCERFVLSKSDDCLDAIVEQVFLKYPGGIKFNHEVFSLIFNHFKNNHRSVTALLDTIQYTAMSHCYANAMSSMMLYDGISQIQPEMIRKLRQQDSFERYGKRLVAQEQWEFVQQLIDNNDMLPQLIQYAQTELNSFHVMQSFAIEFLRCTKNYLKVYKWNSLYNLYSRVLSSEDIVKDDVVQDIVKKIKWITPKDMEGLLRSWVTGLGACQISENTYETALKFTTLLEELLARHMRNKNDQDSYSSSSENEDEERARFERQTAGLVQKRLTKSALKAGIMHHALVEDKKSFKYLAIRVSMEFEQFVRTWLGKGYKECLWYEMQYYENAKTPMTNFQPHPRPIIQTALGATSDYLSCRCCRASDVLHPSALDISLVYRLHNECGHMINLFDMFTGFELVVRKEVPKPAKMDIQARFAAALTHLEFMGFIKPTTRKTDHALKLTASFL
ncbi:hypothetical protein BCR33DRAFT_719687 [Rhizoclosmatium globosum]|uniref:Origin recognition complex subunit 3 n=1 Tax=Rhizoclosmatium globosum TaxID=329046 RepID=A0A1Y2BYK2_9FUNG|nr:hypothetical protein BCR33DRAFT_719687 [Rhizoclosmatium globosum]|eukprot:ORY39852.1 hypothetical protein BCR33DRAFT_719687 [Rhizoclosmatium globosum]